MSQHPLNLALRFALVSAMLAALGVWGWTQHAGMWRARLAVAAASRLRLCGAYSVRLGDPGNAPVRARAAAPGAGGGVVCGGDGGADRFGAVDGGVDSAC